MHVVNFLVLKNIKPNLLQITKKDFDDKKNFITNRPLLYKTGIYYFEIQSLKDQSTKDNLFVGFLLRDKNHLYNTNHNNHLGFRDDNSFGLFFCNGDMYGFNKNNVNRYANGQKYCSWGLFRYK